MNGRPLNRPAPGSAIRDHEPPLRDFMIEHAVKGAWRRKGEVFNAAESRWTMLIAIGAFVGGGSVADWESLGRCARSLGPYGLLLLLLWWSLAALLSTRAAVAERIAECDMARQAVFTLQHEVSLLRAPLDDAALRHRIALEYTETVSRLCEGMRPGRTDDAHSSTFVQLEDFVRASSPSRYSLLKEIERERRPKNSSLPRSTQDFDVGEFFRKRGGAEPPTDLLLTHVPEVLESGAS